MMRSTLLGELAGRFDAQTVQALGSQWLLRAGIAIVIAGVGIWAARLLSRALERVLVRMAVDPMLREFLRNIAYAIGVIVTVIAALDTLGVPTTSMLAVLGAAGLAIGLALKDSLSNIASGVMLIVQRPFHAGDSVQIAGLEGTVESVQVFQTLLRTPDNRSVILPNSLITTAPIVNLTGRGRRRVDLPVAIAYDQDIGQARALLLALAQAHEKVLAEPAGEVVVRGLGDSAVDLQLRAWVAASDYEGVRSFLLETVHREFRNAGITIPFPQREVRLVLPSGGLPLAANASESKA